MLGATLAVRWRGIVVAAVLAALEQLTKQHLATFTPSRVLQYGVRSVLGTEHGVVRFSNVRSRWACSGPLIILSRRMPASWLF